MNDVAVLAGLRSLLEEEMDVVEAALDGPIDGNSWDLVGNVDHKLGLGLDMGLVGRTGDARRTCKRGKITDWLEGLGKGNEDLMEDSDVDVAMEVTMMEVLDNHEVIASFERDKRKESARVQRWGE